MALLFHLLHPRIPDKYCLILHCLQCLCRFRFLYFLCYLSLCSLYCPDFPWRLHLPNRPDFLQCPYLLLHPDFLQYLRCPKLLYPLDPLHCLRLLHYLYSLHCLRFLNHLGSLYYPHPLQHLYFRNFLFTIKYSG